MYETRRLSCQVVINISNAVSTSSELSIQEILVIIIVLNKIQIFT